MGSLIPVVRDRPGTHVLVIGVSAYRHFDDGTNPTQNGQLLGMKQLSAAAHSASEFAAWMNSEAGYYNSGSAIASLRVLLSPSPGEVIHPDIAKLLDGTNYEATRLNVETELRAFYSDCAQHRESIAVVYIAGHGVQLNSKHGAVVLLHDCGSPDHLNLLEGAIDVAGVHAGFDHPNTAQTQFWFVDACRQTLPIASRFETLSAGVLTLNESRGSASSNPLILAAASGTQAYARVGGKTLFNEALMWGLGGKIAAAPDPAISKRWHVSVYEMVKQLSRRLKALASEAGVSQTVDPAGRLNDALFHEHRSIPKADLKVEVVPDSMATTCSASLRQIGQPAMVKAFTRWPILCEVDAGLYELSIAIGATGSNHSEALTVKPPMLETEVRL